MYRKIIHFHIAKTGGTSLNRWLDTLVPASRARPADRGSIFFGRLSVSDARVARRSHPVMHPDFDWGKHHPVPDFPRQFIMHSEYARDALAYWDVVHDHSPSFAMANSAAYRCVVLRDPVSRFMSFLRDWRRLSEAELASLPAEAQAMRRTAIACDADTFVRRHADSPLRGGMTQTKPLMIAAMYGLPRDSLATHDPAPLALATTALETLFDLVGVAERMDDVVRCIARDVGACPVESLGRHNQGVADPERDALSPESRAILHEICSDDFQLYAKARALLEARLVPTYGLADFEAQHLERRLAQLAPRFSGGRRVFSLNDQIIGCGFHGREAAETENVTVWTGPGPRTILYLPVPPGERLDLSVDIGGYIHSSIRESLRIRVDERECVLHRTAANGVLERIVVQVLTTRPYCKVELLVDRTFTPAEAGLADHDGRRLGMALRGYGYSLTATEGVVMRQADESSSSVPQQESGADVVDDAPRHDSLWGRQLVGEWVGSLAAAGDAERLIDLLAWDVPEAELNAPPTAAGVEFAFRRFHMRPAPQEWLDFWLGREDATLRHLYRDLVACAEFKERLGRLAAGVSAGGVPVPGLRG